MFKNTSVAGTGMFVVALMALFQLVGIDLTESFAEEVVQATVTVIGFVLWTYGQLRRQDLKYGLLRK
jgi:uncharacterized protein (DUF697 family)